MNIINASNNAMIPKFGGVSIRQLDTEMFGNEWYTLASELRNSQKVTCGTDKSYPGVVRITPIYGILDQSKDVDVASAEQDKMVIAALIDAGIDRFARWHPALANNADVLKALETELQATEPDAGKAGADVAIVSETDGLSKVVRDDQYKPVIIMPPSKKTSLDTTA